MAEVLLDPIIIKSNGTVVLKASRIIYVKNNLGATANLNVKIQLIKEAHSSIDSSSTVNGRIVKIVKSNSSFTGTTKILLTSAGLIKYVKTSLSNKANVALKVHKYKTSKSELISHSTLETYIYERDIKESMVGYLPPLYQDIKDFQYIIGAEANEFTRLNAKLDELLLQFNVSTATYSLGDWEKFTKVKRYRNSLDSRRNEVKKKILGPGTVTPAVLKAIVDDYHESDMDELPRPGIIEFKFKRRGRLDKVPEILEDVNEIIPRHLEPVFSFTFLPWNELDMIKQSWEEVQSLTMADASTEKWRKFEGVGATWNKIDTLTAEELEESYNLNLQEVKQNE